MLLLKKSHIIIYNSKDINMEQYAQISKSFLIYLCKGFCPLHKHTFLALKQDYAVQIVGANEDTPDQDKYHESVPVLITAGEIKDIEQMAGRDFRFYIFDSNNLAGILQTDLTDQLVISFDFRIPEGNKALTFEFTFPYDSSWLDFLLRSNQQLLVFDSRMSLHKSLALDVRDEGFRNPVWNWLSSRSR
jgi:hypothetical protein